MKFHFVSFVFTLLIFTTAPLQARNAEAVTDLATAMETAKSSGKLLFVKYGREACGNCRALGRLIEERDVKIDEDDFVFADINCDDKAQKRQFYDTFEVDGRTLPFVVVATPDGKQIASRTGYGREDDYDDFIDDAEKAWKKMQKD
jgi:thioredoxin-like negative regulator of GroEL